MLVTPNDGSPDQEQLSRTDGIEMLFNSQAFVYWKTQRMHELDDTIGDIYGRICDQEFNMTNQLREKVRKRTLIQVDTYISVISIRST